MLAKADGLYAAYRCPATAECCRLAVTGRQPWLWPSEWLLLEERLRRDNRPVPTARADGACPLLGPDQRCTVYADRPFGCRTFFCSRAVGPQALPTAGTDALLKRLAALNLELDPDAAPRPLLERLERALGGG